MVKKLYFFRILFFVFSFSFFLSSTQALEQKGMALGLFSKDENYSYLEDLKAMEEMGVTHILLVFSWYQHDINANELRPLEYDGKNDIYTISDRKLREVIEQATSLGLQTTLFPIIRLEVRNGNDWRGLIQPSDFNAWWASYKNFILHYAPIAQEEKVAAYSVGSELLSREKDTYQWKALIQEVKKVYNGKLLYSANWDHYEHPEFWSDLDYVGVTMYYEISKTKNPTLKQLKAEWKKIKRSFLSWKKKYPNQPLVFTEIGYPSVNGGSMHPWNYFLKGRVDVKEQALAYKAFIQTWQNSPELAGVYVWVWWGKGGLKDKSYTVRNKPAGKLLEKWYKGE